MSTYRLSNAEEQAKQFPDDFNIPSMKERKEVPDGHYVKLGFELAPVSSTIGIEYLWVRVTEREAADGTYYGTLDDSPQFATNVTVNDSIQFETENIYGIMAPR